MELPGGAQGSVTIGGTVSPAGGNFEEPVTQSTLKVVGAFHGLSRARADARRFPSIDPLESWSKYEGVIDETAVEATRSILRQGNEVRQMMTVVGEEGVSVDDFVLYLKSELLDAVYMQQNSFDPVDAFCPEERQHHVFGIIADFLARPLSLRSREEARDFFNQLRQRLIDWNYTDRDSDRFAILESEIKDAIAGAVGERQEAVAS